LGLEDAGGLLSVLAGALAALALARFMGGIFGGRAGLAAGLLYAVLPLAVRTSSQPLSEGAFHALLLAAAWSGHRALRTSGPAAAAWTGAAAGLAYLARPEGLAVGLVAGLGLLVFPRRSPPARRLAAAGLLALGLLVTAGPYAAQLSARAGALRVTAKKDLAILAGATAERPVQPLSDEGLAGRPDRAAAQLARHLAEALGYWPLGLALLGIAALGSRRRPGELFLGLLVLLFLVVLFRVALTYGYLSRRHALTPGVLALGWSGVGLERLAAWIASAFGTCAGAPDPARAARRADRTVFGVLLLAAIAPLVPVALADREQAQRPLKALGIWIREHVGPEPRIAPLGYPRVCYYAGATPVEVLSHHQAVLAEIPPPGALAALGAALREAEVRIVIQSSRQPAALRGWIETISKPLHRVEDPERKRWWCARLLERR
ncbi:MAG: glycosyltransferase family 39 protein, partial [Planctomycetes bacterium]|nr:glycosyltransferase family 39 protein [Planctomycetota bacterium]